jgi:ribosomal protein S18 acetylase RimI-like enzyme
MPSHAIIQLPHTFDDHHSKYLPSLLQKSKTLRLKALQTDPSSFASNYAKEILFEDSIWEARLKNPLARTFVAVDMSNLASSTDDLEILKIAEWSGSTVLFGPRVTNGEIPTANISAWFLSGSGFVDDDSENEASQRIVVYAINAVYVDVPYRG